MAHITSIGAGIFSDLSFSVDGTAAVATAIATPTYANFAALFTVPLTVGATTALAGSYKRIDNIREFPQMGVPPNIVNVPTYGFKTSKQVQGQADSPTFELTLNFVPNDWADTANYLGWYLKGAAKDVQYVFRFTMLNTTPTSYSSGTMGVANTQYFFAGKFEALQINPQLTDANQATLTLSLQSDFYGAFTGA
jgi:hypothetical protein